MRKRFGQSLRIGVAPDGLALVKTGRWGGPKAEVLAELALDTPGVDAIGAGLRQLLADAGCTRWPVSVVLADELTRLWQVVPPQDSARLADLEGAAALRFHALFGESASGWKVSAGWNASRPFLAAALPRPLLTVLEQSAEQQQLALVEIVPHFVAGWNRWQGALKQGAWFGQLRAGVLTLGAVEGGELQAVRAGALPDGAGLEWLGQHVAREALRLNLSAPGRLHLAGPAPAAWNNSAAGPLACVLLDAEYGAKLSGAAQLAVTGIAS